FLTLRVLEQTDREVLFDLLNRSREYERVLRGPGQARAARRRVALMTLCVLIGPVCFSLIWSTWGYWMMLWSSLQGWSDVAWVGIKRSSNLQWSVTFGLLVILGSLFVLARPARC